MLGNANPIGSLKLSTNGLVRTLLNSGSNLSTAKEHLKVLKVVFGSGVALVENQPAVMETLFLANPT